MLNHLDKLLALGQGRFRLAEDSQNQLKSDQFGLYSEPVKLSVLSVPDSETDDAAKDQVRVSKRDLRFLRPCEHRGLVRMLV